MFFICIFGTDKAQNQPEKDRKVYEPLLSLTCESTSRTNHGGCVALTIKVKFMDPVKSARSQGGARLTLIS